MQKKKKKQQKKFATINLKQDGCQQQKLNAIVIQRTVTRCQGLVTFDVSKFDIINNLQLTFPYIKNEISITVALSNK